MLVVRRWRGARGVMCLSTCAASEGSRSDEQLEDLLEQLHLLERKTPPAGSAIYAELLQSCGKLKALEEGKRIHEHIVRGGLGKDRFLTNHLLNMYGKCGCVENARKLFDGLQNPNVVSWSSMIGAYAEHGHRKEALQLYRRMQESGPLPNRVTFLNALNACSNLEDGKMVHDGVVETGFEADVSVNNALLHMYGKSGELDEAKRLFDAMPQRNVVSWNTMMGAYLQNSCCDQALQLFERMPELNGVSFVVALNACSSLASLAEGKKIHAQVLRSPYESEVVVRTAVINMYGKCGRLVKAQEIFDGMQQRDVITWNALIAAYAQHGYTEEALELFRQMEPKPNSISFVSVLGACASPASLQDGRRIHARIVKAGFESEAVVRNALVSMYSKCGSLEDAQRIFDKISVRDGSLWNVMIAAYIQHGNCVKALECFHQMQREGARASNLTFVTALNACTSLEDLENGKMIHAAAARSGFDTDMVVGNALLSMYGKCGSVEEARMVFEKMSRRNVVSWTSIIAAYSQHGQAKEALQQLRWMQLEGGKPNEMTLATAIDACAELTAFAEGKRMHGLVLEGGFESDGVIGNALVNLYGKCGSLQDACRMFNKLQRPNVVSWTAIVAAHAQQGHGEKAFKLFRRMQQEGVLPNQITFISIITACSHAGLADEGPRYFASMNTDYGLMPTGEHYLCTIDLCGRAGWLAEAEAVIKRMPFEPGVVAWMTLLGHCKNYGDLERGERAAEQIFEIRSSYAPAYAVLSNMYAAAGRCADAAKLRKRMADVGIKEAYSYSEHPKLL